MIFSTSRIDKMIADPLIPARVRDYLTACLGRDCFTVAEEAETIAAALRERYELAVQTRYERVRKEP